MRPIAILALGAVLSALVFFVLHEAGYRAAANQRAAWLDRAVGALQHDLDSARRGIDALAAVAPSGASDVSSLLWYEAARDHPGLLASARRSDGGMDRLRLLSPQTPVWMSRIILASDDLFLNRVPVGGGLVSEPVATPLEAPAAHRLFRLAAAGARADGAAPVTLVLVDATALLTHAIPRTPLRRDDVTISDLHGPLYQQRQPGWISWWIDGAPLVRTIRFADQEWTLTYGDTARLLSAWDILAIPLLLGGLFASLAWARASGLVIQPALAKSGQGETPPSSLPVLPDPAPIVSHRPSPPATSEPRAPTESAPPKPSPTESSSTPAVPARPVPPSAVSPAPTKLPPDRTLFNGAPSGGSVGDETAGGTQDRPMAQTDSPVEGFVEVDLESGRLVWANTALAQLLGYPDLSAIDPDASGTLRALFAEPDCYDRLVDTVRRTGAVPDFDAQFLNRDGARIDMSVAAWPLRDQDGTMFGFAATLRDITPRKAVERDLIAERERADARSRAKSEFIANMSHELRTPLNAILGFSEIMTSEMFGALGSERYRQYASDIHVSGRHLLDVVNDILDLSKIEASRFELSEEAVDLRTVAEEVVRLVETRATAEGVRLRIDSSPGLPGLRGDSRLIRQILLNLLSNAIKFTPRGGDVVVSARNDPSGGLMLVVRDTGIGMRPEDLPRALEPFGQVHGGGGKIEGTGLGLPLAKSIAECHEGSLSIASEFGAGTTVIVRFPAARVLRA